MNILIGADFVPTESNSEYFRTKKTSALFGAELTAVLSNADFSIFNLETPLSDREAPIIKCGPNLIAPTDAVNGYAAVGVGLLALANNHILDQGAEGLKSTLDTLKNAGIDCVGAGADCDEARAPYVFECDGKRIGVYACAEHEFSISDEGLCGANPFDPIQSIRDISALRDRCDYLIVLYHGGKEHYRYPSPMLQKTCRAIADRGADLVICQHSHCIGCEEKYNGSRIVYGQGNFLFDRSELECWQTSLLISITDGFEIKYIPLVKAGCGVRLANAERAKEIMSAFAERGEQIKEDGFIKKRYAKFASEELNKYLFSFSGIKRTFLFKVINKLSGHRYERWLLKRKYGIGRKAEIRNFVECEAHRELLIAALKGDLIY